MSSEIASIWNMRKTACFQAMTSASRDRLTLRESKQHPSGGQQNGRLFVSVQDIKTYPWTGGKSRLKHCQEISLPTQKCKRGEPRNLKNQDIRTAKS